MRWAGPMSKDDVVLKALADIRRPAVSEAALWSEALLALGIGLLLALVVAALLRLAIEPRAATETPLAERVSATVLLPVSARLAALARLARESGTAIPDDTRTALYRPTPEAELAGHASRLEAALLSR